MKVIFFDIDGTLLNHEGRIPQSTREALVLAKERGHRLILCSGRNKCAVKQLMERFAFDGCVCSAGAYVEYQGQIVSEKNFTKAALNRLIDFLEQTGASYGLQCKEYIACPVKMYDEYEKSFGTGEAAQAQEEDIEADKLDDISKTFVFVDDIKAVSKVEKAFYYGANVGVIEAGRLLGSDYDVRPASYNMPDENNGEISMDGITKSYGMQKLLDFLRADRADTVAFGDGYNDVEMLSFVETGVAMGNAVEELKQVADYVTDSVEQDGIFNAMKFLGLI